MGCRANQSSPASLNSFWRTAKKLSRGKEKSIPFIFFLPVTWTCLAQWPIATGKGSRCAGRSSQSGMVLCKSCLAALPSWLMGQLVKGKDGLIQEMPLLTPKSNAVCLCRLLGNVSRCIQGNSLPLFAMHFCKLWGRAAGTAWCSLGTSVLMPLQAAHSWGRCCLVALSE